MNGSRFFAELTFSMIFWRVSLRDRSASPPGSWNQQNSLLIRVMDPQGSPAELRLAQRREPLIRR